MKYLIMFFLLLNNSKAQNVSQSVTDTSMVVGLVKEDCFVGKILNYCLISPDKELKKGSAAIICGIQQCKQTYGTEIAQYYEICRNKETYFIEKDKLATMPNVYEQITLMSSNQADTFKKNAQNTAELLYKSEIRKALKFLDACKPKGLAITKWSIYDESEYTEGTSFTISVYNPTPKTIKYIWVTVTGYNPVNDKIIDRKRGTSNITVKAVGPLEPDHTGTYEFSYVWFTDLVQTALINSIKVQYMDGSIKLITNPKQIELSKELYNVIYEEDD